MITRAHIRRQLRASGGITNAVPRQGYFLGKLVKKVTRPLKKIAKSPLGKAALLYAGTAGLGALGARERLGGYVVKVVC